MLNLNAKIDILNEVYWESATDESLAEFAAVYDVGVPLAGLIRLGAAEITDAGESFINNAFDALCEAMGIDNYGDYGDLADMQMWMMTDA